MMEVRTGFKPVSADLQSAAWSLCYRTLKFDWPHVHDSNVQPLAS